MIPNYFHSSCNKTVRKFYEDFDLLPPSAKELIWHENAAPNFDDLKAAWQLAGESFKLEDLLKLHSFEEERKAEQKRLYKLEQQRKKQELIEARKDRYDRKHKLGKYATKVQVYQRVRMKGKKIKDNSRLIKLVSDEQALKLLTQRKENKEIVAAGSYYVNRFIGWEDKKDIPEKPEPEYAKFEPEQHICKAFHNS